MRCVFVFAAGIFCVLSVPFSSIGQDIHPGPQPDSFSLDRTENRFRHSVYLLRDLYEKILALDHHFTSLKTHGDVFQIANPQTYPEFQAVTEELRSQTKRRYQVDMPEFLGQNAIISGAYTLLSIFLSDKSPKDKSASLDEVSCLLDFTMRMQTDMNIIVYETEFLRESNERLMELCKTLFLESCGLFGYDKPLDACREEDDWERVFVMLDRKFTSLRVQMGELALAPMIERETNNFNFRIDRTTHFIQEYATVIAQGLQHYRKFEKIITSYEDEHHCLDALPASFTQLKSDVHLTLQKFNHAYQLPGLYGSRLKALLYGAQDKP